MKRSSSTLRLRKMFFSAAVFISISMGTSCDDPNRPISDVNNNALKAAEAISGRNDDKTENTILNSPVNSTEETVEKYELVEKELADLATSVQNGYENDYVVLVTKTTKLKENAEEAGNYLAQHRSDFSKEQLRKITNSTNGINTSLGSILATKDK
ncbi:hypothetical protein QEG73_07730 [Chitinophagaceae bacterium 26-R-25]|nr:hypothetical protein [Chitinophagaceae bacterium 26-R-25]